MGDLRYRAISAFLKATHATRLDKALAPLLRGRGVILTLHHVTPVAPAAFAPNAILEITPAFLADLIGLVRAKGYDLAAMDEVPARLAAKSGAPFAVFTLDDGYRDNAEYAAPVFRAARCPFTLYVAPGFAEAVSPLWWRDLEEVVARENVLTAPYPEGPEVLVCDTPEAKTAAFKSVYWRLRNGPEERLRHVIAAMAEAAGVDPLARTRALCMGWDEVRALAADPLCAIGAHTLTHPMLARHDEATARHEMAESRRLIEAELGRDVRHFSYPVGDPASAGAREFALARACGFETAVTTRPGVLTGDHAAHLMALPRISVNGLFQNLGDTEALLSGLPTFAQNRGRFLNVG